jgi:DNA-binding protein HU-beta
MPEALFRRQWTGKNAPKAFSERKKTKKGVFFFENFAGVDKFPTFAWRENNYCKILTLKVIIMNKTQLIDAIAEKAGLTKADSKKALEAFVETVGECLKKGDKLSLVGFGSFCVNERGARSGRNPQTGKSINIPAKKVVKFKAGAELSDKC